MLSHHETLTRPYTFSVIIPAYNSASFLPKAINSVLCQTFADFELILVDDGSADDTLSVCLDYARRDERIVVLHQENQGHTSARNLGLVRSRGQYILFLDSDDWIDPDTLSVCHAQIALHKPDVLIYGLCQHKEERYCLLKNRLPDGFYTLSSKETFVLDKLLMTSDGCFAFPKSLSGKVFKREKVWNHQLGIPQEVRIGEDGACFVSTVLDSDSICVISDVCYHYAVRENSVSRSSDKLALRRCLTLLQHYRTAVLPQNDRISSQFDRFVVTQIYTAVQFVALSNGGHRWLKNEFYALLSHDFVCAALKNARFDQKGWKLQIKQAILRYRLLRLVKPLITLMKR